MILTRHMNAKHFCNLAHLSHHMMEFCLLYLCSARTFMFLKITNRLMSKLNRVHDMSDVYSQYLDMCFDNKQNIHTPQQ